MTTPLHIERAHKYRAKKTECISGHSHPSKAEARRCDQLRQLERCRIISDLTQQPKFPCIVAGIKVCTYVADFSYRDEAGNLTIEDVKSGPTKTRIYQLKKKLVEALYPDVKITEIGGSAKQKRRKSGKISSSLEAE